MYIYIVSLIGFSMSYFGRLALSKIRAMYRMKCASGVYLLLPTINLHLREILD
jgi:hypothetical protein